MISVIRNIVGERIYLLYEVLMNYCLWMWFEQLNTGNYKDGAMKMSSNNHVGFDKRLLLIANFFNSLRVT